MIFYIIMLFYSLARWVSVLHEEHLATIRGPVEADVHEVLKEDGAVDREHRTA